MWYKIVVDIAFDTRASCLCMYDNYIIYNIHMYSLNHSHHWSLTLSTEENSLQPMCVYTYSNTLYVLS